MKRLGYAVIMTVSLTFLSGSGSIGDIEPGWTVQSEATSIVPGRGSGGTGQVSLECGYGYDSEFVIDNPSVLSHDDLGSVFGKVGTVNPSGREETLSTGLSITTDTLLQRLNADRVMPPVWYRNEAPQINLLVGSGVGQVANVYGVATSDAGNTYVTSYGSVNGVERQRVLRFDSATGDFISEFGFAGSGAGGFGSSATPGPLDDGPTGIAINAASGYTVYVYDGANARVNVYTLAGVYVNSFGSAGTGDGQFAANSTGRIAVDSVGNVYVASAGNGGVIQKFSNTGSFISKVTLPGWFASPYGLTIDSNDNVIVSLLSNRQTTNAEIVRVYDTNFSLQSSFNYDYDPKVFSQSGIDFTVAGLGMMVADPDGQSLWANPISTNYVVRLDYNGNELQRWYPGFGAPANPNDKYSLAFDPATSSIQVVAQSRTQETNSLWYGYTGNLFAAASFVAITLSEAIQDYVDTVDSSLVVDYLASEDPEVILPGWSGNLWGKLNELCAAYNIEIILVNGVITVRDAGSSSLGIEDVIAGSARLSLDSTATGRSVNIVNYNTTRGAGVAWDAADSGTIFSVEPGETRVETVQTTSYLATINPPTQTEGVPVGPGEYYIIGSDNLPVDGLQWRDYGGDVRVAISSTIPGGIEITIVGPREEIPGVPAPYSLAVSDGENTRPAFSVTGMGVFTNPQTVNLLTGADPAKTSQGVAQDIDNIFIGDLEMAYDRGAWACFLASGPQASFSVGVPTGSLSSFGTVVGSRVMLRDGLYRIDSSNFSNASTSLDATPFTNTADVDQVWSGETTGDFDAFWDGNDSLDFKIKPLRHP